MARSKSSSSKIRRPRILAAIRPNVRASLPSQANTFELPLLMRDDQETDTRRDEAPRLHPNDNDPVGDHSTGSLPSSRSTTQTSSSSAKLDEQRRLSMILTPTSSEASQSEDGTSTTRATFNIVGSVRHANKRRPSRALEQVLPTIDETLAGQGRWVPVHIDAMQDIEFVQTGSIPDQAVVQGHSPSPWSGLHQPADPHPGSVSPVGSDVNRGGRRGGLGREKAAKVGGMRVTRACLRCFVYRIECDELEPCSQCRRKMRTWNLGCTRRRLPERLDNLLPTILTAHLELDKVRSFMDTNAECYRGEPFYLPLTQFLGERGPLWLQVREVDPLGDALVERPAFTITDAPSGRVVQAINLESLPVVPFWPPEKKDEEVALIDQTLEEWLRAIAHTESNWPRFVFPPMQRDVYVWERNIMRQICRLFNAKDPEHAKLEVALELTFCNYIVIHYFAIPPEQFTYVYSKLRNPTYRNHRPKPGSEITARAVNTFLAMFIMKKIRLQGQAILEHLSVLFAERKSTMESAIIAFSESFLFLVVLAQLQTSVLQHAIIKRDKEDTTYPMQEAHEEIRRMEKELATVIIELCVFKLRKVSKKMKAEGRAAATDSDVDMDAENSSPGFFDGLHKITELCGGRSEWQTEIGIIDEHTFEACNVGRLLRKLYQAVSQVLPPAADCHVELDRHDC